MLQPRKKLVMGDLCLSNGDPKTGSVSDNNQHHLRGATNILCSDATHIERATNHPDKRSSNN